MIALPTSCDPDHRCRPSPPSRGDPADACLDYPQHDARDQQLRPHHCALVRLRVDARELDDDCRGSPYRCPCHRLCSRETADDRGDDRGRCSMLPHAGGIANLPGTASPNASNTNNPDNA